MASSWICNGVDCRNTLAQEDHHRKSCRTPPVWEQGKKYWKLTVVHRKKTKWLKDPSFYKTTKSTCKTTCKYTGQMSAMDANDSTDGDVSHHHTTANTNTRYLQCNRLLWPGRCTPWPTCDQCQGPSPPHWLWWCQPPQHWQNMQPWLSNVNTSVKAANTITIWQYINFKQCLPLLELFHSWRLIAGRH